MEVKSLHVPPENILQGELETLIIATIQTLNVVIKIWKILNFPAG